MTIIELLNKIANGEEVPNKIRYRDWLYDWNESAKDYQCGSDWLEDRDLFDFKTFLNDKVEIIEEEKKIERIIDYDLENLDCLRDIAYFYKDICNELIDEINKLKEKE